MKHAEKAMHRLYPVGRSLFAILILLFCSLQAFAQGLVVKGVVKDATGEVVIGANVLEKGTTNGVITNIDGAFTLSNVNAKGTLVISFIGYTPVEVAVNGNKKIDVTLKEDAELLDEVVVVGYGTQKKASVTGSVSAVKGKDLQQAATANLTNAIAGRMPGVISVNRSGEPGADFSEIYIRGTGTLGSSDDMSKRNAALIVIDGVANRGGFERLNPSDIESLTVLKDASAAIYGAQAANGVILITTKKGTAGPSKPTITYDGSFSISQHTRTPYLVNAYEFMTYQDEVSTYQGDPLLYDNIKEGYLDGTIDRLKYADTDWMKAVFTKAAPQTKHSLSLSGATERLSYYVSGSYLYQEPNYRNTVYNFNTAQLRSNIEAKVTDNFKVGLELAGRKETRNNSIYETKDFFWEVYQAYPYLYDYYPNGLPGPGISKGNNLALYASGKDTGYDKIEDYFMNSRITFNLQLPWITKGLYIDGYAAFDLHFRNEKKLWDQWDCYQYNAETGEYENQRPTTNNDGYINIGQWADNDNTTTLNFKVGYNREFGDHNVGAFVAYEQSTMNGAGLYGWRGYYLSSKVDYLDAGSDKNKTSGGNGKVSARQNFFGRFNYAYKDRYLAEFTLRRDGSQNFSPNTRWGTFPGMSVGWRIGEESFVKDKVNFIDELKLRASWGKLGNDIVNPFQYVNEYVFATGDPKWLEGGGIFGKDPTRTQGFYQKGIANPLITWEKVDTKNIGVEGRFWKGLLGFDIQYFYEKRTEILTKKNASVPAYTGLVLPDQNIGAVDNYGLEVELSHRNHIGNVNYYLGGNFSFIKNKIVFFDEAADTPEWQRQTGHAMGSWLLYKTDGIYQNQDEIDNSIHFANAKPGDIKFVDVNGDKEITSKDMVRDFSRAIPEIVYGINMGAEWKGISLNILWTGQARAKQLVRPAGMVKDKVYYDGRWKSEAETPNAKYPRAFDYHDPINMLDSDFWLRNAAFLRLKNVELAYTLPQQWIAKAGMSNVRIYLTGNNLFSIDSFETMDPEGNNASGMYYPQQRTYTVGVNVSF